MLIYQLLIYPIELLLGIVFSVLNDALDDPGMAIIGVSIVVNLLMLPLYKRADMISSAERKKQKEMEPMVTHIKSAFKGDERFMILQTYYRKQNYRPLYSLKSSLPLLLQIPFFMAAYHFLSHLSLLNGRVFGWITDLGSPDRMIVFPAIGLNIYTERHVMDQITMMIPSAGTVTCPPMVVVRGFGINVLPFLMTLINIISVAIYTKGSAKKEKIQLYVMAAIFLCLLYRSPSGLVVYWTANNIFSLIKNVLAKLRRDKARVPDREHNGSYREDLIWFVSGAAMLVLLLGVLIPSSVIASSPSEFVTVTAYRDPLHYVGSSFVTAMGLFMIWLPVFYYLASPKARHIISVLIWVLVGVFLVDFLTFGRTDSYLSPELRYDAEMIFTMNRTLLNLAAIVIVAAIMTVIAVKRKTWVRYIYTALLIGTVGLSAINMIQAERLLGANMGQLRADGGYESFSLSRTGKNVIVFMLDRAIGTYIPFIMAERPELAQQFSGFVYYPNTISFGGNTVIGSPALYGGYEYTPESMEARGDEKLVDKHNEALKVLPVIFSENGYTTTVYDPPLAGYEQVSNLSIYKDYPDIHAYSLKNKFVDPDVMSFMEGYRERAFFMYSICKVMPLACQPYVYEEGNYHYPDELTYPDLDYLDNINILKNLDTITDIEDSERNTFMIIDNETPHRHGELQLPDYELSGNTNNRGMETGYRQDTEGNEIKIDYQYHYHANITSLIQIGRWLDYLKQNGVYDNTRIIIAADHGARLGQFDELILDDGTDVQNYIPLLMFKDFDAEGFSTSWDFMTNADTPVLALNGLIDDPVNPFTGQRIDDHEKTSHDQIVLCTEGIKADKERTEFYEPGVTVYSVHDNVYDKTNWQCIKHGDVPE